LHDIGKSSLVDCGPASNKSQKKLQLYHDYLALLLQEVKHATNNKPVMMINLWSVAEKEVAHTSISCHGQLKATGLPMWEEVY
jgi:hypothetical protein